MLKIWSVFCQHDSRVSSNVQTSDNQDMLTRVLGREQMNEMIIPTIPKTMEQVPCSVMVFIATVKVNK